MWVRGPCVSAGYIHQPEETAAAFRDGWYRTSDLVRRDADGFYFFVGRKHDMLKVGGIRVFPLEIEQVLIAHPEIDEAVVVRAEERVRGEVPRAVVRIADGSTLSVNDVKAWCREHMAVYKVPRFVEFWADIPKLPNGKIDRKAVEARAPAEAE
jgi:long-chain acyl-CoA synthetase